jgi:tetratricopeptide (TPR) repeat protein
MELELAGDLMRDENRYRLALQLYKKAHQLDPERISAHIEMLSLQARLEFQSRNEALTEAKRVLLTRPDRNGFASVANALIKLDRYQELIDFSNAFIDVVNNRNPKLKALALRNLGVAYSEIGEMQASLDAYEQAFNILPGDENTLKPYLSLLEEQGRDSEYNEIARRLIAIDPSDISYYLIYIECLIKAGSFSEAGMWLEKAKKLPKSQLDEARLHTFELKIQAAASLLNNRDAQPCGAGDAAR